MQALSVGIAPSAVTANCSSAHPSLRLSVYPCTHVSIGLQHIALPVSCSSPCTYDSLTQQDSAEVAQLVIQNK